MTEQIIQANSGTYGRVQVTLLLPVKDEILSWAKQLGVNKASFLRMALMIGASQLVKESILASNNEDLSKDYSDSWSRAAHAQVTSMRDFRPKRNEG